MKKRLLTKIRANGLIPLGLGDDQVYQNPPLKAQAAHQQQENEAGIQPDGVVAAAAADHPINLDDPTNHPINLDDPTNHPINLDGLVNHSINLEAYPNPEAVAGEAAVEVVVVPDGLSDQDQEGHNAAQTIPNVEQRLADLTFPPKKQSSSEGRVESGPPDPFINLAKLLLFPPAGLATKKVKWRSSDIDNSGEKEKEKEKEKVDTTKKVGKRRGQKGKEGYKAEDDDDQEGSYGSELYLGNWKCKSSRRSSRRHPDDNFGQDPPASSASLINSSLRWGNTRKRSVLVK